MDERSRFTREFGGAAALRHRRDRRTAGPPVTTASLASHSVVTHTSRSREWSVNVLESSHLQDEDAERHADVTLISHQCPNNFVEVVDNKVYGLGRPRRGATERPPFCKAALVFTDA